jgi:HD-GYP domain-containing protein (c-di-GMP phosphodiesterase class II)
VAEAEPPKERVRAAEVAAALCMATDVGMGFRLGHGLRTTLISMRLCDRLGVAAPVASDTYYATLLAHAGCTTDASVAAEIFGAPMTPALTPVMFGSRVEQLGGLLRALPPAGIPRTARALEAARRLPRAARQHRPHLEAVCEVAARLSVQLGLPASVCALFADLTERWDGRSVLGRAGHDAVPLAVRITHVAMDAELHRSLGGQQRARAVVSERAGHALDPAVATCLVDEPGVLGPAPGASEWDDVLAAEPGPSVVLEDGAIDRALGAMAGFADLLAPCFAGHSVGVAELAAEAGARCGLDPAEVRNLRRAGLVHDLGRVAVAASVWNQRDPLDLDQREQIRLHPYHGERILSRSPALAHLGALAGTHHERLDRSGYHRGLHGVELTTAARVLAAADVLHASVERRPHRPPHSPQEAVRVLAAEVEAHHLDPDAAAAVIEAAGQRPPRLARPADLSEREAQVLRMVAAGMQTKQVARSLGISVKTADRHVQNVYGKIGVSTRPAATLFAMEHGLLAWGELPMAGRPGPS